MLSLTILGDKDNIQQMFENDFVLNIYSEEWDSVWEQTKHAIQFKIICWQLQITPYIRNKMNQKCSVYMDSLFGWFLSLCMIAYIVFENYCHCSKQEAVNEYRNMKWNDRTTLWR